MRRRYVSEEERDIIIRLRKSGAGWLKIESMTRVPRRTAKRIFQEWQQAQSAEEIKAARRQVAAESFNLHMRDLITLAQAISTNLADPELKDRRDGRQVLNNVFESDIRGRSQGDSSFSFMKNDPNAISRQNRILFDSLKQHTQGKVDWGLLDKWLSARDDWHTGMRKLEVAVGGLIRNMLRQHSAGSLGARLRDPEMADQMRRGVVETAYHALVSNKYQEAEKYINVRQAQNGFLILFGGDVSDTELVIETMEVAVIIAGLCRWEVEKLFTGKESSLIEDMATSLASMREAHNELVDKLDELRLAPLILQTKCDICPA